MLLTVSGIVCLIVIYFIGKKIKKNIIGKIIMGVIFGLFIEMSTSPMFIYDTNKLTWFFIIGNEEIVVGILLAWGCVFSVAATVTELIQSDILKRNDNISYYFLALISMLIFGLPLELIGHSVGMWRYSCMEHVPKFFNVPWPAVFGWIFPSGFYLAIVKIYGNDIDKIIQKKYIRRFK